MEIKQNFSLRSSLVLTLSTTLPTVTVIMPILNEADFIRESIGAILAQDYPAHLMEILVVDGGSTDGTRELVQQFAHNNPSIRLLDNPRRIQAAALNIGIMAGWGDIIVRVDGHTIVAPDYVSKCVDLLTQGKAEGVGGLMRPEGITYTGSVIALALRSFFGVGDSKFHYSEQEQYVDTVYLGAYWRRVFDEIGLYDEAVHINEDYELNYRLRQAGGRILLNPAIHSTYTPRSNVFTLWRQYYIYGRQKVRTLRKHPKSLRWRQTVSPLFVSVLFGSLLAGFVWPPVFLFSIFIISCYLLTNLAASTVAVRQGGWRYFPLLPIVFTIMHLAWGLGFWWGLVQVSFTPKET